MLRFTIMLLAILSLPVLAWASAEAMAAAGLPAPNPWFTMGTVLVGGLVKRGLKKAGISSKVMPWLNLGATAAYTAATGGTGALGTFAQSTLNQFFNNWGGHKALKGLTAFGTRDRFKF